MAVADATDSRQSGGQNVAAATKVRKIPLQEIWAYHMPGTRDVRELEPSKFGTRVAHLTGEQRSRLARESVTEQIIAALPHLPAHNLKRPLASFAVAGKRAAALHGAFAVLAAKQKPQHRFTADNDISAVFFSHASGLYVHLKRVELQGERLKILYQFVSHPNKMLTRHFALIPLGQLPPGNYTVEIIQDPDAESKTTYERAVRVASESAQYVISGEFSFVVQESLQAQ